MGYLSLAWGTSPWHLALGTVVSPITISHISSAVLGTCLSWCPLAVQQDPFTSVLDAFKSVREEQEMGAVMAEMVLRLHWGYVSEPHWGSTGGALYSIG